MAPSSSNKNSANARLSSVLPTPVGPRKIKEPIGRFSSCNPARARRTALLTATMASRWPITRSPRRSSICTSFSFSPSRNRDTGMPVQLATISAMSSSVTSSLSMDCSSDCTSDSLRLRSSSFVFSSGSCPYWISLARARSPMRWARSSSNFASSICSCKTRVSPKLLFSACHWALRPLAVSFKDASSCSNFCKRSWLALSFSFINACRSISACMIWRSTTSISTGMLSSSILSRDAASSTRSTALSGRNRSEIYRCERFAAATNAASWMRMPWCTS